MFFVINLLALFLVTPKMDFFFSLYSTVKMYLSDINYVT